MAGLAFGGKFKSKLKPTSKFRFGKKHKNAANSSKLTGNIKSSSISPSVKEFSKMMGSVSNKMPKKSMFKKKGSNASC